MVFGMSHAALYLAEVRSIAEALPAETIEALCDELVALRARDGRLFFLGVGGSAGNCGHAVNDFRKLCGVEAYAPTDNVSELTARTNDEGWHTVFSEWLKVSRANAKDAIFVLSVGGGNLEKNVSPNLVAAIQEAKVRGMRVFGIVGRDGGYTKQAGDTVIVIPTVEASRVTPHAEAFQGIVWHCLVSHPKLQKNATKW
jgi:D-sedoheptulose 7-phosphate isomerase